MEEWNDLFGDATKNLGKFYSEYTPERLAAIGLSNNEKEFSAYRDNLQRKLKQQNLGNSNYENFALQQADFS